MIAQRAFLVILLAAALVTGACAGQADTASGEVQISAAAAVDQAAPPAGDAQNQAPAGDVAPVPTVVTAPLNAAGEPLAARVNGIEITHDAVERAMARYAEQQVLAADASALRDMVLNALIDQALIDQAAATQNLQVSDADVQAELDANKQIAGSDAAWQQWLADNQYSEDEFRATVREALVTGRIRDVVTQDVSGPIPHVHARHILVATEADAAGLLTRVRAGEDFAALAASYSSDVTTKDQGGDLGWFAQGELLEPYLAQVAFALQPGDLAGPVATSLGYHVLQTLEREDRVVPEEKRAVLAQGQFEQWLQSQRAIATIERY